MVEIDKETKGYMIGMFTTIVTSLTTLYISTNYILNRTIQQPPPTPTPSPYPVTLEWSPLTQEQVQQIKKLTSINR